MLRLWRTFWGAPREVDRSRVFATCWHCGSAVPCHETWAMDDVKTPQVEADSKKPPGGGLRVLDFGQAGTAHGATDTETRGCYAPKRSSQMSEDLAPIGLCQSFLGHNCLRLSF